MRVFCSRKTKGTTRKCLIVPKNKLSKQDAGLDIAAKTKTVNAEDSSGRVAVTVVCNIAGATACSAARVVSIVSFFSLLILAPAQFET
jgi:hypothetical protein